GRAPAPPAGGDRPAGPAEAHAGAGVPPRHGDPHRRAGREDPARHLRRHGDAAGRRGPVSRRPRRGGSGPTGIAIVDKPAGWTSHDVVAKARGLLGTRKVGHSGTLDPDATGVLVLGVGRATRLLTFLSGLGKRYVGEVVLGTSTTTLDASGEVTGTWDMSHVDVEDVRRAATGLTGHIDQVPPMVSAKKVDGRRLHELAREGIEVERPPVRVRVDRFEVGEAVEPGVHPIDVTCSAGTYVRSL